MAPTAASPVALSDQSGLDERDIISAFAGRSDYVERSSMGVGGWSSPVAVRSAISPRSLGAGSIAGITIGTVFGAGLLLICLYPVVVNLIKRCKRRKNGKESPNFFDGEMGTAPGAADVSGTASHGPRRLSSRDSFAMRPVRPSDRQSTKELNLASFDGLNYGGSQAMGPPQRVDSMDRGYDEPDALFSIGSRRQTGFSLDQIETTPGSQMQSPQEGQTDMDLDVSQSHGGYNEEYYSPSVPSEAFGMITPPPTDAVPMAPTKSISSRASSFKHNVMAAIRKRSSQDSRRRVAAIAAVAAPAMAVADPTLAESPQLSMPLPTLLTAQRPAQKVVSEEVTESPVTMVPPVSLPYSASQDIGSPIPVSPSAALSPAFTEADEAEASEAKEPSAGESLAFRMGQPSPPIQPPKLPSPGTVNPMDIMKPSNQTELNHHTTHELYKMVNGPTEEPKIKPEPSSTVDVYTVTEQAAEPLDPLTPAAEEMEYDQSFVATERQHFAQSIDSKPNFDSNQEVVMTDAPPSGNGNSLVPHVVQPGQNGQELEFPAPSDQSTPYRGPASSNSVLNTPETRPTEYSPSPRSDGGSSDMLGGISPYPAQTSPRAYTCDECRREFDQIHKLNHHKRYHERPHECTHPGCGKRFGTKTHLDRHINDKHNKTRKFHCTEPGCPYSRQGGKSFPRKDNWRRHMMNIHSQNPQADPEPDIVDEPMNGT